VSTPDPFTVEQDAPVRPAPEPGDFQSRVREYSRLRRQQSDNEDAAKSIKDKADELEKELLDEWAQYELQNQKLADGSTVYLDRKLWARVEEGVDKGDVLDALVEAGHEEFVTRTFNSNTLSAWLRELERDGTPLPEPLVGKLSTSEVFKLKIRRS